MVPLQDGVVVAEAVGLWIRNGSYLEGPVLTAERGHQKEVSFQPPRDGLARGYVLVGFSAEAGVG